MNLKRFLIIPLILVLAQNIFAYHYKTEIYDYVGRNVYNVVAVDLNDTTHVAAIYTNDAAYCIDFSDKNSALEMYQILKRMNVYTLDTVLSTTRWKYWFTSKDGVLFYRADGMVSWY